MLIKSADDKSKRLTLLLDLQNSPRLDEWQKKRLGEELLKVRRGIQGEKDAAHYLDNHFIDGKNHAVIHDLRLEVDGQIAQIDHLLISRMLNFYMLETKNFAGDVTITPHGEFSVKYGAEKIYNIPSPIEQSKRHENVLRRLLTKLDIVGRAGMDLQFKHVVLVDPKAAINRPNAKTFNTSMVIAADQFRTWHLAHVDKDISTTDVLFGMLNFKSTDALKQVAEKICRQHRPENLLHLPDWLQPQPAKSQKEVVVTQLEQGGRKKLICLTCNSKISYDEGKFCWNNDKRFKGGQYCRTHQASF